LTQIKKYGIIILLILIFSGCGRIINETGGEETKPPIIPINGNISVIGNFMVSIRMDETQKNPCILKYNDLILVTYLDNHDDRINLVYYNDNLERIGHKVLNHQYPIASGAPNMTIFNDNILIVYEAFSGGYMVMYDINGNKIMEDVKVTETNNEDLLVQAINSTDVMLIYEERNEFEKKSIMSKILKITLDTD